MGWGDGSCAPGMIVHLHGAPPFSFALVMHKRMLIRLECQPHQPGRNDREGGQTLACRTTRWHGSQRPHTPVVAQLAAPRNSPLATLTGLYLHLVIVIDIDIDIASVFGPPGRIVTTVVRTASELSDLQVSLLEDVLALIKQERKPSADGGHDMYDAAKRGSWRSPNSYEGALFNEVVDGVRSIRSGAPISPAGNGAVPASARARTELEAANRVAEALKREMLDRDRADVCAVTVTIKGGEGAMQERSERQHLQTSLLNDVSRALGVMPKRLEVVGMHRADARGQLSGGDYDLDLFVLPCSVDAPPTEAPARKIAEQVVFQASNPGSPLRELPIGSRMTRGEHRSTYEYVHRLRHTVRILQEEVKPGRNHHPICFDVRVNIP